MLELGHKEGWAPKNWCFQTMVLEKTLVRLLDYQEMEAVNSKANQPWVFIGKTDAEAPVPWPPDEKSGLIKRPWCWERLKARAEGQKRMRWLDNITDSVDMSLQILWDSGGQRILVIYSPWGHKGSDMS